MKILVTGANGQVGYCLSHLLAGSNWDYLSLTREQLDISDADQVGSIMSKFQPDVVINAAAYTAVDKAEIEFEQANKINILGAKNLAVATSQIGAAIFHISTDYVFAGDAQQPYREDDTVAPQSVYGLSKLKGEQEVAKKNPQHIILRTAWVFGEHGNNFVKTMIRLGRDREQLSIVGDQFGGPTYAGDIAGALLKMVAEYDNNKSLPWGIYHFSGFPQVSWFDFAKVIFDELEDKNVYEKKIPKLNKITTADYPTPAKRPANSRLNCEKIQKTFGIDLSNWKQALNNIKAYS